MADDEVRSDVPRLYRSGLSVAKVAAETGLPASRVYRIVRAAGANRSRKEAEALKPPGKLTEADVQAGLAEGLSQGAIAGRHGVTKQHVSQVVQRMEKSRTNLLHAPGKLGPLCGAIGTVVANGDLVTCPACNELLDPDRVVDLDQRRRAAQSDHVPSKRVCALLSLIEELEPAERIDLLALTMFCAYDDKAQALEDAVWLADLVNDAEEDAWNDQDGR